MTLQITIPPELEGFIQDQVNAGLFSSPEQLVKAALEQMRQTAIDARTRLIAELHRGIDDLEAGRFVDLKDDREIKAFFDSLR